MTQRPTALVACALGLIRQGHDPDTALRAAVQRIPCSMASVRLAEAILAAMVTAPVKVGPLYSGVTHQDVARELARKEKSTAAEQRTERIVPSAPVKGHAPRILSADPGVS